MAFADCSGIEGTISVRQGKIQHDASAEDHRLTGVVEPGYGRLGGPVLRLSERPRTLHQVTAWNALHLPGIL